MTIEWISPEGWKERAEEMREWAEGISGPYGELADRIHKAILADSFEDYLNALAEFPIKAEIT